MRSSLDAAQGNAPQDAPNDYFDAELVRMVEEFQRKHRLNVDGVAGVQTQMVLDTLINTDGAPLLIGRNAEGTS